MSNTKQNGSGRKDFFLVRWLKRLFFPNKEMDIYAEEQMQSPLRVVVRNYFSKPLSVIALLVFIMIAIFVFVAPNFVTLDLGEQDSTLVFISPGFDMMKYPKELEKNGIQDIAVGNNYSVGVDKNGRLYVWGKHQVTKVIDLADIPAEIQKAKIVQVAAGADHCVALDDKGVGR